MESLRRKALMEAHDLFLGGNVSDQRSMLDDLLNLLVYLHETLAEEKIQLKENERIVEEIIIKFFLHGIGICKISESYKVQSKYYNLRGDQHLRLFDLSSLLTLGRAQMETMLMYQHLYINSKDEDEQMLRYFAYISAALLGRSKTPAIEEESKLQRKKDEIELALLKSKITSLNAFGKLTSKQQKSLISEGSGKLFKHWSTIFKESGFQEDSIFNTFYYQLSAYSHSEGLSLIQLRDSGFSIDNDHNRSMCSLLLRSSILMTSVMIGNIISRHEMIEKRFRTVEEKTKFSFLFFLEIVKPHFSKIDQ